MHPCCAVGAWDGSQQFAQQQQYQQAPPGGQAPPGYGAPAPAAGQCLCQQGLNQPPCPWSIMVGGRPYYMGGSLRQAARDQLISSALESNHLMRASQLLSCLGSRQHGV